MTLSEAQNLKHKISQCCDMHACVGAQPGANTGKGRGYYLFIGGTNFDVHLYKSDVDPAELNAIRLLIKGDK